MKVKKLGHYDLRPVGLVYFLRQSHVLGVECILDQ